ncbi:MAG: Calx-beta domain-containing protein [Panacagrimonas sp.]
MTSRLDGALFRCGTFAAAIASLFPAIPAFALPRAEPGEEFRVNRHSTGDQVSPSIAHSASGDFVVAWADYSEDRPGIYFRRYQADGTLLDRRPVRVDTPDEFSATPPRSPDVAMDEDGDFVIAWLDLDTRIGPGNEYFNSTLFARRYASTGRARDASAREIARSGNVNSTLGPPSIAMDSPGNFVVAYDESDFGGARFVDSCLGVFFTRHSPGGRRLSRTRVGTESCSFSPSVAMEPDGDFVIAHEIVTTNRRSGDFVSAKLVARRYDAGGTARDPLPAVVAPGVIFSETGDLAVEDDGDFIVTWSTNASGYPVTQSHIMARRFTSGGVVRGAPIQVNSDGDSLNFAPRIGIAGDGSFTLVWERRNPDTDDRDILRRSYDGRARSIDTTETRVNEVIAGDQHEPALAVQDDGSLVVAWQSSGDRDGSGDAIYALRQRPPPSVRFETAFQRVAEGIGTTRVVVTLSRPGDRDVRVPVTRAGTATDGQDYQLAPLPLVIPAGAVRASIELTVIDDGEPENGESVVLRIGRPGNAVVNDTTGRFHRLIIVSDD